MEYRRRESIGDYNIDEVFEGTPDEILEVLNGINEEDSGLIYDQEDAIKFIYHRSPIKYGKDFIKEVLELEEDYMRSVGIICD